MLRLYKCTHCGLIDWIRTLPCLLCGGKGRVLFGRIPIKDDLGKFKKIVITSRFVDDNENQQFICVFENYSIAMCLFCPYYQDVVGKCTLFNIYEHKCDVCKNEPLSIPYLKILKDVEEILPRYFIKKCCMCKDRENFENYRKDNK